MDATDATFEQDVIERSAEMPVVVDFWAAWCGPCLALGPVLEREVEARAGQVELVKVDVDANQEVATRFGIAGIPAVKAFRGGRVVSEFVGARSAPGVASFLDELLAPPRAEGLVETLRAEGTQPEILSALDGGDIDGALTLIVEAVAGASMDERERLRELAVALFEQLGQDSATASIFRRRLATALY